MVRQWLAGRGRRWWCEARRLAMPVGDLAAYVVCGPVRAVTGAWWVIHGADRKPGRRVRDASTARHALLLRLIHHALALMCREPGGPGPARLVRAHGDRAGALLQPSCQHA